MNSCQEPRWLDRVAAAVRDRLRRNAGNPVIGHGDWHPENLRWKGPQLIAVHDWDSVICQPEPAIAGLAAASFLGIEDLSRMASVEDSAAFLDGDPERILTRHEARARLRLAGLNPGLAAEGEPVDRDV